MACNHTNINCGCKDSFLTTPPPCPTPVDCPTAQPCSEVFDAQCIVYTGDPIICDQDTVVATNTNIADALNNIVDYVCNKPVACCPTFAVDIYRNPFDEILTLYSTLTNGTAPFTYEWTVEQNDFEGLSIASSPTSSSITLNPVTNNYIDAPGLGDIVYMSLVKLKVTDSAGQIASAYFTAIRRINA